MLYVLDVSLQDQDQSTHLGSKGASQNLFTTAGNHLVKHFELASSRPVMSTPNIIDSDHHIALII